MTLEDALLLRKDDRTVLETLRDAGERQAKHERNERDRLAAGLPTDLERWQKTGMALD